MMTELASLVFSILAFFLSVCGFLAGCWAVVQVLAFKNSTHRITQLPVTEMPDSRIELDLPQHILDQLPSPPDAKTIEDHIKWERQQQAEADLTEDSDY